MEHEIYMQRCIELASKGIGKTSPNPLVGAVIVHNNSIIAEGYHEEFGKAHAEVNAIQSIENKSVLKEATLYVNLEPCSHFGKTPPCADLIVANQIPKVVIGSSDPFPEVAGKGIDILRNSGVEVICGILEKECIDLNKRFYIFYTKNRPYIILKWAQTNDHFIASLNQIKGDSLKITNQKTNVLVHQWRSHEQAILVGEGTILADNPQLNVRLVEGKQPIPLVLGKKDNIPSDSKILGFGPMFFSSIEEINQYCVAAKIQSILVEGGAKVLEYFIQNNFWDEARIITNTSMSIGAGVKAPAINKAPNQVDFLDKDQIQIIYNTQLK